MSNTFDEKPRAHFDTFAWSLVTVFQVITGENWNTVMYDVMHANSFASAAYFIGLIITGAYIMMNLFLAVLLFKTMKAFAPEQTLKERILVVKNRMRADPFVRRRPVRRLPCSIASALGYWNIVHHRATPHTWMACWTTAYS